MAALNEITLQLYIYCTHGVPHWRHRAKGNAKNSGTRVQVNKIRESLGRVVRNSTAAGLRQPHLERTRLCELSDAELDPVYVHQRDALRDTVRELAHPKSVNGQVRWACIDVLYELGPWQDSIARSGTPSSTWPE